MLVNQSTVSWPPTPGPVIYVVMTDGTQLCQTLQSSVSLPPSVDPSTVRVLVVDWRGLVKVFCPVEESPIDQTLRILRSLGMEGEFNGNLPKNSSHHTNLKITCSPPWRLSIESVLQQPPLVVVQISWRHYHNQLIKIKGVTSYMVTWTMSEGVVKGNVFTNASTITLSLLPETVYRIQVLRFDEKCQSEVIVLDTSSSSKTNLSSTWNGDISQSSIIMYRWQYARHVAMLVFILVIAGVVWRWRYGKYLPKNRKFYERI
ncbi:uncharacterized protein LOC128986547 [Macrosteles quadrilineatus]|uniref:uncharacterized protein LOC128986547 n=1 Tax=Macrosteles quadrilineatus TaxID=74068 RepID=UPI0023E29277|nr:uncharacterized protein LOC128986547 [Macrosteles quadrilineatus]